MPDPSASIYLWIKALHIVSAISWMAGLLYLPRLFVYHAERAGSGGELSDTLKTMERKLLKIIINPAGIATWFFGSMLAFIPGVIDWSDGWVWVKLAAIVKLTWFHQRMATRQRAFEEGRNEKSGRYYRLMNEVPAVLMLAIVLMAVVKPF